MSTLRAKVSDLLSGTRLVSVTRLHYSWAFEFDRVGLTTRARSWRYKQLSAKWESLVLSPALNAKRPRERLLFVGNDNDFRTRKGFMPDGTYDGGIDHDNMVLVYRVTLPAN